jgi:hypothetical protein
VRDAVSDALPILTDMGLNEPMSSAKGRRPLVTRFVPVFNIVPNLLNVSQLHGY